jgi:hypothetical protein
VLFGGGMDGMDEPRRREGGLQRSGDSVRVLLATDAAAEGLNLQRTARYLLHFDCPWNPSRSSNATAASTATARRAT